MADPPDKIQREICDAFQLPIRYDHGDCGVELSVTIAAAVPTTWRRAASALR